MHHGYKFKSNPIHGKNDALENMHKYAKGKVILMVELISPAGEIKHFFITMGLSLLAIIVSTWERRERKLIRSYTL